jgi:hypothetical protein
MITDQASYDPDFNYHSSSMEAAVSIAGLSMVVNTGQGESRKEEQIFGICYGKEL